MRHPTCTGLLLGLLVGAGTAAETWPAGAVLRVEAAVVEQPSDRVAGVLVTLPDGGVLPPPPVGWKVFDSSGRELASVCVWHNPAEGIGLVFEPPSSPSPVTIYLGGPLPSPSAAAAELKPSLLLYTRTGGASLEGAQAMANEVPPGRRARMGRVRFIGHRQNPWGPDDDYESWYTGWLRVKGAGPTRFCTISDDGSILKLDGQTIAQWPGIHSRDPGRKGEFGSSVNLRPGFYRVDYFHFEASGDQEAHACWKPPDTKSDALPVTIPESAFLHSGRAEIRSAISRDGGVPAFWTWSPVSYLWYGDKPAHVYRFRALLVSTNTPEVSCEWQLGGGLVVRQPEFLWIIEGHEPVPVTLTVRAGGARSRSTRQVELDTTPPRASVENAQHRLAYRRALLTRCEASPATQRPCAGWSSGLWTLLLQVLEPYRGGALLKAIFERSRPDVLALPDADRRSLEDQYVEILRYSDREAAARWLERLEQEEKDPGRKAYWKGRAVEFYLYDMEDTNTARRLAENLLAAGGTEAGRMAALRLGDIERLAGRSDEARSWYARAQDLPRPAPSPDGEKSTETLPKRRGGRSEPRSVSTELQRSRTVGSPPEPWKAQAVRASSYYRTVHNLIEKGAYPEARQTLEEWEQELPLSKLDGDYSLAEAEYFRAIGDLRRALKILQAYRRGVAMSAFLPAVMEKEAECWLTLGRTDQVRALADRMERQFPGHPASQKVRGWVGRQGEVSSEAARARSGLTPIPEGL